MNGSLVIADLETTHRDVDQAGVCQIAAVMLTQVCWQSDKYEQEGQALVIQPLFQTYAQPSEHMSAEAQAVHGITPDMYQYSPTDVTAIWAFRALLDSMPQPVVLSGYNCTRYDYQIMDKIYPAGQFGEFPHIDVMTLMMRKYPQHGLKLVEVFTRLFPENPLVKTAHDAMADCHMTALVLKGFMEEYQSFDPAVLATYCQTPQPLSIMPWGKFKGREFKSIPNDYLQWMAGKWKDMHPDLAAAMRLRGFTAKE